MDAKAEATLYRHQAAHCAAMGRDDAARVWERRAEAVLVRAALKTWRRSRAMASHADAAAPHHGAVIRDVADGLEAP